MDTNPLKKEKSYFLKTIHLRNYLEIMDNPTKKNVRTVFSKSEIQEFVNLRKCYSYKGQPIHIRIFKPCSTDHSRSFTDFPNTNLRVIARSRGL